MRVALFLALLCGCMALQGQSVYTGPPAPEPIVETHHFVFVGAASGNGLAWQALGRADVINASAQARLISVTCYPDPLMVPAMVVQSVLIDVQVRECRVRP